SDDYVYIPPDLELELREWLERSEGAPTDWLFQTEHGRRGFLNANNYRNRILQPAAIRAGVGVVDTGKKDENGKPILKTDVDFRALRRTCATLFGDRAKDPKARKLSYGIPEDSDCYRRCWTRKPQARRRADEPRWME